MHIEVVSITVVPYYPVITRDVPVERDCNTITVLLLLLFQINNQSINQTYPLATFVTGDQPTISGRATFGRIIPEEKGSPFGRGFGDSFRDRAHHCMLKSGAV